jgi:hypothetical protein
VIEEQKPVRPRLTSGLCASHHDMPSRTRRISNATAAAARLLLVLPLLLAAELLLLVLFVLCMLVLPLMLVCCRHRLNSTCKHAEVAVSQH